LKISVVGAGYVGLTVVCLADFGHEISLVGRTKQKIDLINQGKSPIYEPGLEDILKRNLETKRVLATTDYNVMDDSDVIFICVGTPSNSDGSIDLSQIKDASKEIGLHLKRAKDFKVVVVKSTVVPRTVKNVVIPILEKESGKKAGLDFGVAMNPEFLREGEAVYDFMNPDKIVMGITDNKTREIMDKVYEKFDARFHRIFTDLNTAEMIKYAQNSMLASRVSFINEIANICEKFGVDVKEVASAIGLDTRIGPKFLNAGIGFGGSCFPKDVNALLAASSSVGYDSLMLKAILGINELQPLRLIQLAKESIGDLSGKAVAILGLAFKPKTDDMREARAIPIIRTLLEDSVTIRVYDPQAMENAKQIFGNKIEYCSSVNDCIKNVDLIMIVTEWDEFKNLDLSLIKCPIIDGRRVLDPEKVKKHKIIYKGIGWKENYG